MNDEQYLREAIRLARQAVESGSGGPFGAIVVRDGEIVGKGSNRVTSSNDPTAHAEIVAIRDACRRLGSHQLTGCVIYCSCEPCPMCLGAIYWARPESIVYAASKDDAAQAGFDDTFIYSEMAKSPEQRLIHARQIPLDERLDAFRDWENQQNRIEY